MDFTVKEFDSYNMSAESFENFKNNMNMVIMVIDMAINEVNQNKSNIKLLEKVKTDIIADIQWLEYFNLNGQEGKIVKETIDKAKTRLNCVESLINEYYNVTEKEVE